MREAKSPSRLAFEAAGLRVVPDDPGPEFQPGPVVSREWREAVEVLKAEYRAKRAGLRRWSTPGGAA